MEKSSASKPRTSNNTAYTKAAIISSATRSRIFYMYPECERASATEKPRISRLFCFLYIQPQLFDGLIFIIDFPADGTYGPVIDDKGSVLLFLEHVDNKFAILRIPAVIQGDLEIETALTGFRIGSFLSASASTVAETVSFSAASIAGVAAYPFSPHHNKVTENRTVIRKSRFIRRSIWNYRTTAGS